MNRLRNRLIFVFLASTLIPLGATLWITSSLLERSLGYAATSDLDQVSRSLEVTAREFYRQARDRLRSDAAAGHLKPAEYPIAAIAQWPSEIRDFWDAGESERFFLEGERGERLNYAQRAATGVRVFSLGLGPVGMTSIREQYRQARGAVEALSQRDLRRGFIYTFVVLAAAVWLAAMAALIIFSIRISRPIHQLTRGLTQLAEGNFDVRLPEGRNDEIGSALLAFNHTAARLRQSRDRLIYLAQMASWQSLARKMAHEVKNSLTPIRLSIEEIVARRGEDDPQFIEQAAQIVAEEVDGLERRIRAFSDFASEPPVRPRAMDLNAMVAERVAFLGRARSGVEYRLRLAPEGARALADEDLVRGILTNLIENAAEAAGPGGITQISTGEEDGAVIVEVHDSGPGLSPLARETLFEPTISFKRGGMGLGLSIARKSALLSGGDITLVQGELGGAGFRVRLPRAAPPERARMSA